MSQQSEFILGEFERTLDDRFRLSIPSELSLNLVGDDPEAELILAKERPGCLSLWNASAWEGKLAAGVDVLKGKMRGGKLEGRLVQVQLLGRLLSTRHKTVQFTGKGRVLIPEGFREFLKVEPGGDVLVIGAGVCIEIWHPATWVEYLQKRMPKFQKLFDRLTS